MNLVRFDPFRDAVSFQNRMNRFFEPFLRTSTEDYGSWLPAVDIREDGEAIRLQAEIPGLKQEDIEIHIENNILTLKGERKQENEVMEQDYHRVERSYGSFSRSFSLPTSVNSEKIQAVYKDGILDITLPKSESSKSRKIKVTTN